jgi:glutamyl-tRNA reductase
LRLDESQAAVLEQLTRAIVNKIMHAPISRLRDETDREAGLIRLEEARSLFGLDDESTRTEARTRTETEGEEGPNS